MRYALSMHLVPPPPLSLIIIVLLHRVWEGLWSSVTPPRPSHQVCLLSARLQQQMPAAPSQASRFLCIHWQWTRWHRAIKFDLAYWWLLWIYLSNFGGYDIFLAAKVICGRLCLLAHLQHHVSRRCSVGFTTCISYASPSSCAVRFFHGALQRQRPGVQIPGPNLSARQSKSTGGRRR